MEFSNAFSNTGSSITGMQKCRHKGRENYDWKQSKKIEMLCYSNLNVHLSLKIEGSLQFLLVLNNVLMFHCLILSVSLQPHISTTKPVMQVEHLVDVFLSD